MSMGERDSVVRLTRGGLVEVRNAGDGDDGPEVWLKPLEVDGDGEVRVNVAELREAIDFLLGGVIMPPR